MALSKEDRAFYNEIALSFEEMADSWLNLNSEYRDYLHIKAINLRHYVETDGAEKWEDPVEPDLPELDKW
ncbi:hypothetical protein SAMN05720766_12018 [Fibrobacter sp. UWH9]|uniref:hypothetical protein n=1 Tax=Fibrobacter sp. UWH9 TaxID=1896213 RepID=UPI000917FABD|nr:hypothetical protein [Fibrobacter sp. UWH9]SHH70861.1 hypothetical protein SAMN05720766_12018 [Fibrobacter sp. UWH9]